MIDFAKSPGVTNADALIANAVAYRQHPRNAININGVVPSTPYCLRAARNPELQGVVNAQLDGVNPSIFGSINLGLFAFGDGELPLNCWWVLAKMTFFPRTRSDLPIWTDTRRVYMQLCIGVMTEAVACTWTTTRTEVERSRTQSL